MCPSLKREPYPSRWEQSRFQQGSKDYFSGDRRSLCRQGIDRPGLSSPNKAVMMAPVSPEGTAVANGRPSRKKEKQPMANVSKNGQLRVAIAGLGAIGKKIAEALDQGIDGLQLAAVSAQNPEKHHNWLAGLK